jgi:DNA mismatch repair ATPase MutS
LVTAGSYRANVTRRIFTHFIREEDAGMTSGRLDDELRRLSAIADRIAPGCLMLFNEPFAGSAAGSRRTGPLLPPRQPPGASRRPSH